VEGACVDTAPKDAACSTTYPEGILDKKLVGKDAPLLIGSIFSLGAAHDQALTESIKMAVSEMNQNPVPGVSEVGVVFCDNVAPGNVDADNHAIDYLAGTLGVPYIVGPLTSGDSLKLLTEMIDKKYPSVIISPSATSPALSTAQKKLASTDKYPLFWRTCPSDELQGVVLARDVIGKITTIKTVTVLHVNDPYGSGFADVFATAFSTDPTAVRLVPYDEKGLADPATLSALIDTADKKGSDAVLIIALHGKVALQLITAMQSKSIASKPFFFTDGVKDSDLVDPAVAPWIKTILAAAQGTAPAPPTSQLLGTFTQHLAAFAPTIDLSTSFLPHAYDATYVGGFGVLWAMQGGTSTSWDGRDVATGMTKLSPPPTGQTPLPLNGQNAWISAAGQLADPGYLDLAGTSGNLDFNPTKGEAPGPVEVWQIVSGAYSTVATYQPTE
jgi:ABC-type branched-subunit amino acid transport system substrate-binding protein